VPTGVENPPEPCCILVSQRGEGNGVNTLVCMYRYGFVRPCFMWGCLRNTVPYYIKHSCTCGGRRWANTRCCFGVHFTQVDLMVRGMGLYVVHFKGFGTD
jgi:hypothetical protein